MGVTLSLTPIFNMSGNFVYSTNLYDIVSEHILMRWLYTRFSKICIIRKCVKKWTGDFIQYWEC